MKFLRLALLLMLPFTVQAQDITARVENGYADSGGVRIHYATLGNPKDPPVLMIHGLDDPFLLPGALDGTWQWVDNTLTVVTLPHVGRFVLRDAPTQVIPVVRNWLAH